MLEMLDKIVTGIIMGIGAAAVLTVLIFGIDD